MSDEQKYDPPTIKNGTWNPVAGERLAGRLVSMSGIAYEFAPGRAFPLLRLMTEVLHPDGVLALGHMVDVHCGLSERLLHEIEAVRPQVGEDIEISVNGLLVDGFPEYVVRAGGRWSTAEHWGPDQVDSRCVFSAAPLTRGGERTAVMHPVIPDSTSPYFRPSPTPREGGSMAGQLADAARDGANPYKETHE